MPDGADGAASRRWRRGLYRYVSPKASVARRNGWRRLAPTAAERRATRQDQGRSALDRDLIGIGIDVDARLLAGPGHRGLEILAVRLEIAEVAVAFRLEQIERMRHALRGGAIVGAASALRTRRSQGGRFGRRGRRSGRGAGGRVSGKSDPAHSGKKSARESGGSQTVHGTTSF